MSKCIFFSILILIKFTAFSQSYLGVITKQVNFREDPGTEFKIISSLSPGAQIFIISLITENEFSNIIDIANNIEGFVHSSFVFIEQKVEENYEGIFSPISKSSSYNSDISIFNNTAKKLTLKLNNLLYQFNPKETRTIIVSPGNYSYIAFAPEVIPYLGKKFI